MRRRMTVTAALLVLAAACGGDGEPEEATGTASEPAAAVATEAGSDAVADYDLADQPAGARPTFVTPADGDTVTTPVQVEMAAEGVTIAPAGELVVGEGHLHVIVDRGCAEAGEVLPGPSDDAEAQGYFHFGDGSTTGEIALEPGPHELCLQLTDGAHQAFGETQVIRVLVE